MKQQSRRFLIPLLIVALSAVPVIASALDDGGGRSVFATGAGNRALALGSAYCALADDASAIIWNPAGLGHVSRRQLQVTHTTLFGLGFNEQYASLVLPSWRWGAASLTFRRFGVDGIEGRDDRNLLLDDDISDNETEIALGFGRRLTAAWSAGVALKMQRQVLAGYSDSGLGADIGVSFQPSAADGLTLAAAARNIVEPAIRLDQEATPDPTSLRLGAAYKRDLFASGSWLLTCDLEKTRDMDSRVHAGLELRLVPSLALRGGLCDGTLTAGSSITARGIDVDYAFEDNELGTIHRMGLSVSFGPTTEESRLATEREAEEHLQRRLQEAFAGRQRERLADFYRRADAAMAARQYETVLDITGIIQVFEPEQARTSQLENKAWRLRGLQSEVQGDLAGATLYLSRALAVSAEDTAATRALRRVRAESDRLAARSDELRELFDDAMDAFVADDLAAARSGFAAVLGMDPDDREASAMLQRAEDIIEQRRLRRQRDAADAARAQVLTAAVDTRTATTPPIPESRTPARPSLSAERRREIADLYQRGIRAAESGDPEDAIRYWELVWNVLPDYERVAKYLVREYLARGMEAFVAGDLADAVRNWQLALDVDPDNARARSYLERAQQQLDRIETMPRGMES